MNRKILLTIPAYNNAGTIADVITKASDTGYDVLVVNDGSTDKTKEAIKDLDVFNVDHTENIGKGAAILTGLRWAKKHNYSHIITIDADGQHNPSEVVRFVPKIEENPLSMIVGTRDFSSKDVPKSSRVGRKLSNFCLKLACGTTVPDSQSGFRAYPVDAILKLNLTATGYNFEIEVLAKAVWARISLNSIDISVHYSAATREASHFKPIWDNIRIANSYAKLILRRLGA